MAGNAPGSANRTKRPFTIPKLRPTLLSDMWTYHSSASRSTGLGNAGTMHARSRSWRARSEILTDLLVARHSRIVDTPNTPVKRATHKVKKAVGSFTARCHQVSRRAPSDIAQYSRCSGLYQGEAAHFSVESEAIAHFLRAALIANKNSN